MGKSTITPATTGAAAVDVNAALGQFQQATQSIETQYPGALSAFQSYVAGGAKGALDQQTQAQLANLPVSSTATAALDELRGFMGLPTISPTAGLSTQVNGLITQLGTDPANAAKVEELKSVRDQLDSAEGLSDPAEREAMKSQMMQSMQEIPELSGISGQFEASYGKEASSAWSPEVIQSKLEATPGYQFRMHQGMQAMDRTAAAKGGLLSGGQLAAAQEFGQGLASQEYQNRIGQLQQAVATQAPGVTQQAGLLAGAGQQLSQTGQQMGAAAGDIGKGIAQAGQQAATLSGQGLLQAAGQTSAQQQQANLANAQMQQQAQLANQQAEAANSGLLTQLIQ